jgi:hypothetical protein
MSGGLSGKLSIPVPRQKAAGITGVMLLVLGVSIYVIPLQDTNEDNDNSGSQVSTEDDTDETNLEYTGIESWREVGNDSFTADNGNWKTHYFEKDGGKFDTKVVAGVYRLSANFNQSWWQQQWSEYDPVSDFYIAADVKTESEHIYDLSAGLLFRASYNKFYRLDLIGTKYYRLQYVDLLDEENSKLLIDWTYVPSVDTSRFNRIGVEAIGSNIRVFINGKEVGQVSDSSQLLGNTGFIVQNYKEEGQVATFDFDNFELKATGD